MAEAPRERVGKCPACGADGVRLKEISGIFICEKCSQKRFSNKVRKGIEEAFERQQEATRRQAWKQRMRIASRGMKQFEEGKFGPALRTFNEYISILEARYRVAPGGLSPNLFHATKDAGEVLLIAGIYWDLAKIYDKMKGGTGQVRTCLNKFTEFSLDKPHLVLSSEAIRKYLASGKCINKTDFKNAHALTRAKLTKCFVASAVFEDEAPELTVLRAFRDEVLATFRTGRTFIGAYYAIGPSLARILLTSPRAAAATRLALRKLARLIARFTIVR